MFVRKTPIAVFANKLSSPPPSFSLVQQNGNHSPASASIVTSLGLTTTAGNTILIFANGAGTISTPTGFTSRSPQVNAQGCYLFEKLVASGNATDTPTLTMSGAFDATWQIAEYSGVTSSDTSSGNNAAGQAANPLVWSTPSIIPAVGNRLLVAFAVASGSNFADTMTGPGSWTSSFTGRRSDQQPGSSGTGLDSMTGGWADRNVVGDGSTGFSTSATITDAGTNAAAPASIIAAYATV
jgi:hypothetical protein